jgi:SWI/SNF-related matrix-associated actin-dependent regulator of chromatin subfamily A3
MNADKLSTSALKEAERARKQREKERQQQEKRRQQEEKRRRAEALRAASGGKGGRVPVANTNSEWANQTTPGDDPSAPVMEDILEASQRFNPREIGDTADKAGLQEAALQDMPMAPQPAAIKTKMLPYQLKVFSGCSITRKLRCPVPKIPMLFSFGRNTQRLQVYT